MDIYIIKYYWICIVINAGRHHTIIWTQFSFHAWNAESDHQLKWWEPGNWGDLARNHMDIASRSSDHIEYREKPMCQQWEPHSVNKRITGHRLKLYTKNADKSGHNKYLICGKRAQPDQCSQKPQIQYLDCSKIWIMYLCTWHYDSEHIWQWWDIDSFQL